MITFDEFSADFTNRLGQLPTARDAWNEAQAIERERIAQHFDSRDKGAGGFYDPHEPAEIIRALGPSIEVEAPLTALRKVKNGTN